VGESSWNGYEHNCLFANLGEGRFVDVGRALGSDDIHDGRAFAAADFDGDGRLDLAINNNGAPPTFYLNRLAGTGNWVVLALVGTASNRDAVGARVRLTAGGRTLTRVVEAGSGYASQSPHDLHFGLGAAARVEALEIHWPSGRVERIEGPDLDERVGLNRVARLQESLKVATGPAS
jgi:hypothetical protein